LTDARFKVNSPPVIHQTLDGEVIVVNLDTGTYYSFEGVAAEIWAAAERGLTVAEVVSEAAELHGASSTAASPAVTRFLAELAREELIVGVNGSAPFTAPEAVESASHGSFPEPLLNKYTDMQELLLLDPIHDVDERGWPNAAAAGQDTTGS
jgi:hypothetical protein